ncbi:hypothetical protein BH11VER1_BH11VER1_33840 [soil metagenome]
MICLRGAWLLPESMKHTVLRHNLRTSWQIKKSLRLATSSVRNVD